MKDLEWARFEHGYKNASLLKRARFDLVFWMAEMALSRAFYPIAGIAIVAIMTVLIYYDACPISTLAGVGVGMTISQVIGVSILKMFIRR